MTNSNYKESQDNVIKSVVESLDGVETKLLPYLPYILQDLWELGSDPATMLNLIKRNVAKKNLRILDLGCGKGALAIKLAKNLKCTVKGIDALPEFIEAAKKYAEKYKVRDFCAFEVNDIRSVIGRLKGFDVIVLGAIGPVLGNISEALAKTAKALNKPGYVLMDDAYLADESTQSYARCLRKKEFYSQICSAGFKIIQEVLIDKNLQRKTDKAMYRKIAKRVNELICRYPSKKRLLQNYLESQEYENLMLENELVSGTWLLKFSAGLSRGRARGGKA